MMGTPVGAKVEEEVGVEVEVEVEVEGIVPERAEETFCTTASLAPKERTSETIDSIWPRVRPDDCAESFVDGIKRTEESSPTKIIFENLLMAYDD